MKQAIIILLAAFLSSCYGKAVPEKTGLEGKLLPSFNVQLIDSITYLDMKDVRLGKPFAILYFSPQCPYCRAQMDEIVKNMDKLRDIQFYLLSSYSASEVKPFFNEYKLADYSNVIVGRDTSNFFPEYFGIRGVPYMAIYGKDKRLHKTFAGMVYSRQLKAVAED